ncbi:MAG: hypothetical protein ACRC0G_01160 [Fusobacteriaceae bacterium]
MKVIVKKRKMTKDELVEMLGVVLGEVGYELFTNSTYSISKKNGASKERVSEFFGKRINLTGFEAKTVEVNLMKNYVSVYVPYAGSYIGDNYDKKVVFARFKYSQIQDIVKCVTELEEEYDRHINLSNRVLEKSTKN